VLAGAHHWRTIKRNDQMTQNMGRCRRLGQGILLLAAWLVVGWVLAAAIYKNLLPTLLGGNYKPPEIWRITRDFGLVVLPFLLMLGGVPASIQIWRGRPWRMAFLTALGVCVLSATVVVFIVFFGPAIFGWWW